MKLQVKIYADDGKKICHEEYVEYTMEQMAVAVKTLREQLRTLREFEELVKK